MALVRSSNVVSKFGTTYFFTSEEEHAEDDQREDDLERVRQRAG